LKNIIYVWHDEFIIFWNSDRAFFKPNDITFHSKCPKGTVNVVVYRFFSWTWICHYPDLRSNFENIFALWMRSSKSLLLGIWYIPDPFQDLIKRFIINSKKRNSSFLFSCSTIQGEYGFLISRYPVRRLFPSYRNPSILVHLTRSNSCQNILSIKILFTWKSNNVLLFIPESIRHRATYC